MNKKFASSVNKNVCKKENKYKQALSFGSVTQQTFKFKCSYINTRKSCEISSKFTIKVNDNMELFAKIVKG